MAFETGSVVLYAPFTKFNSLVKWCNNLAVILFFVGLIFKSFFLIGYLEAIQESAEKQILKEASNPAIIATKSILKTKKQ